MDIADIKFMHLALVRPQEYRARQRLYSMLERINGTKSLWQRLAYYSPAIYADQLTRNAEAVPAGWIEPWRQHGIDLSSFQQTELNQYNRKAVRLFLQHGSAPFFYDDVWDADWAQLTEALASDKIERDKNVEIQQPSFRHNILRRLLLVALMARRRLA